MASLKEYLWSGKWLYKAAFFFHRFSLQVFRVRAAHFIDEIMQPAMSVAEGAVKQTASSTAPTDSFWTNNSCSESWANLQPRLPGLSLNDTNTTSRPAMLMLFAKFTTNFYGPKAHTIFLKTKHCENKVSIRINDLGQWHKQHREEQTNTTCPICSVLWQSFNPSSSTGLNGFCSTITLSLYGYLFEISPCHCLTATL